ncbi:unnamed protein product, partial [marine sediment metagenome]
MQLELAFPVAPRGSSIRFLRSLPVRVFLPVNLPEFSLCFTPFSISPYGEGEAPPLGLLALSPPHRYRLWGGGTRTGRPPPSP